MVCNAGAFFEFVLGREREDCKTVRFFSQDANRRREDFHLTARAFLTCAKIRAVFQCRAKAVCLYPQYLVIIFDFITEEDWEE